MSTVFTTYFEGSPVFVLPAFFTSRYYMRPAGITQPLDSYTPIVRRGVVTSFSSVETPDGFIPVRVPLEQEPLMIPAKYLKPNLRAVA